jgi:hypothetical protein
MNPGENPTGLRDLPLSQYLLRGMRSNAASQYQELRRLQEEQATVVPLHCGPFRVFVYGRIEEALRSAGLDRSGLVAALRHGVDVQRVEPAEGHVVGRIVGSVDEGRIRIVLAHEPDLPAPANWLLLGLERGGHPVAKVARLTATWSVASDKTPDTVAGDANAAFLRCREIREDYRAWVGTWEPPVVSVPFLILHLDRTLRRNNEVDRLLNGLRLGTPLCACRRGTQPRPSVERGETLTLHAPEFRAMLTIELLRTTVVGPNEWLVTNLDDASADLVPIALLDVRCHPFTQTIREQWRGAVDAEAWLAELDNWERHYDCWRLTEWTPQVVPGGFFNLRVPGSRKDELDRESVTPAELCAAMNRDLAVMSAAGRNADEIIATADSARFHIRLAPYQPTVGASDWTLVDIRWVQQSPPSFARVVADWREGTRGQPVLSGDAAILLQEVAVLQASRQGREEEIRRVERLASGDTPELAERLRAWRRICELERDLLQVGVTRIEQADEDYLLVPEEQETVEEWIEGLESLNPEGVDWNRYPLELRAGDQHARLTVRGIRATDEDEAEIILTVACDNLLGRALADSVCGGRSGEHVRLFLPDTQLRLIDAALEILDPQRQTRAERQGVVGRDLMPDDQSVQTLQAILTGARGLAARRGDWPPLPVAPLANLSPAQEEAVRAAIFGPDMTLIQGPPGTGKTTVILEILRQLFRLHGRDRGFKVLLVAPTHVAVDNVLERLIAPRRGTSLVTELGVAPYRLGSTRRIAEHLRGFTPDCVNTDYLRRLERDVAEAVRVTQQQARLDRYMLTALAFGAGHDATAWSQALETGELPVDGWSPTWPAELGPDWKERVGTSTGRVEAWQHWHIRGNHPEQRADLLQRWLDFLRRSPRFFSELLVANANLVCGTTIGCATHRELRAALYDYVIVDEAGKEEARRLLVPLIRGERWVLVGDHQQLPPYADDDLKDRLDQEGLDPKTLTRSLFEELQAPSEERGCYVFLDRQGRMHPDISAFVSQRFYEGKLHDFAHAASHTLSQPRFLPDGPKLLVLDTRNLFQRYETRRGTGFVNPLEQDLALCLLRAFAGLKEWREPLGEERLIDIPSIGVIAPYRLQVEDLARRARKDRVLKRLLREGLLHVGTVDSFQGQERDLIIFTCTRSNPRGRLGFVDNRQRLNVALSRARSRLIVILDGASVERSGRQGGITGAEAETRDHLHALLDFSNQRGGVIEVPPNWQQRWQR